MRTSSRVIASALGLALTLTACGGHTSSLPELAGNGASSAQSPTSSTLSETPLISIPKLSGDLAYTDAGRRPANQKVGVSITLRYNHQGELDRLVANLSDPHSGHRHFLSAKEFNAHYAPTVQQEASVVRELQRAGFTITKRYANRTIVDATARSSAVERFFSTEIHTVHQGKHGERYTNVEPATVPASIAAYVRDVSLNNLVVVRTVADQDGVTTERTAPQLQYDSQGHVVLPLPQTAVKPPSSKIQPMQGIVNGGFESGSFSPGWTNESTRSSYAAVTTAQAHSGSYSAFMGTLKPPEINGWASIAQLVTVPTGGVLSFWVYQGSNEGQLGYGTKYAWQAGYLLNKNGTILTTFYKTVNNTNGWVNYTVNLSAYAGQSDYIYFGCYGDGYNQTYVYQYVDDVAWAGGASPTPSPTAAPTPTPTAAPTPTPTAKSDGDSEHGTDADAAPTPTPTASPTSTPGPRLQQRGAR